MIELRSWICLIALTVFIPRGAGAADVVHPQYHISGEQLVYDMNLQHFRGSSDDESGRIRIRLDPEVIEKSKQNGAQTPRPDDDPPPDDGGAG